MFHLTEFFFLIWKASRLNFLGHLLHLNYRPILMKCSYPIHLAVTHAYMHQPCERSNMGQFLVVICTAFPALCFAVPVNALVYISFHTCVFTVQFQANVSLEILIFFWMWNFQFSFCIYTLRMSAALAELWILPIRCPHTALCLHWKVCFKDTVFHASVFEPENSWHLKKIS